MKKLIKKYENRSHYQQLWKFRLYHSLFFFLTFIFSSCNNADVSNFKGRLIVFIKNQVYEFAKDSLTNSIVKNTITPEGISDNGYCVSPDLHYLAYSYNNKIILYDLYKGETKNLLLADATDLTFSPDGSKLAYVEQYGLYIVDTTGIKSLIHQSPWKIYYAENNSAVTEIKSGEIFNIKWIRKNKISFQYCKDIPSKYTGGYTPDFYPDVSTIIELDKDTPSLNFCSGDQGWFEWNIDEICAENDFILLSHRRHGNFNNEYYITKNFNGIELEKFKYIPQLNGLILVTRNCKFICFDRHIKKNVRIKIIDPMTLKCDSINIKAKRDDFCDDPVLNYYDNQIAYLSYRTHNIEVLNLQTGKIDIIIKNLQHKYGNNLIAWIP